MVRSNNTVLLCNGAKNEVPISKNKVIKIKSSTSSSLMHVLNTGGILSEILKNVTMETIKSKL